jgi:hypothetical protein
VEGQGQGHRERAGGGDPSHAMPSQVHIVAGPCTLPYPTPHAQRVTHDDDEEEEKEEEEARGRWAGSRTCCRSVGKARAYHALIGWCVLSTKARHHGM